MELKWKILVAAVLFVVVCSVMGYGIWGLVQEEDEDDEYQTVSCEIFDYYYVGDTLTSEGLFWFPHSVLKEFQDYNGDGLIDMDYALVTFEYKIPKTMPLNIKSFTVDGYNDTHFWSIKNAISQMASFPEKLEIQSNLVFDFSNVIDRYGRAYHRVITREFLITNLCNHSTEPKVINPYFAIGDLRIQLSNEYDDFVYITDKGVIPDCLKNNEYFWIHIGYPDGDDISWHSLKGGYSLPEIRANETLEAYIKIEVHGCDRGTFYDGQDYHFNIFIVNTEHHTFRAIPIEVRT